MNDHEPLMKPLVLDLLALVERTLSLADDGEQAVSHLGAIAQANELVRSALDVLPFVSEDTDEQLDSLPPVLPASYAEAEEDSQLVAGTPPPENDWLLGDDDGFNLG